MEFGKTINKLFFSLTHIIGFFSVYQIIDFYLIYLLFLIHAKTLILLFTKLQIIPYLTLI